MKGKFLAVGSHFSVNTSLISSLARTFMQLLEESKDSHEEVARSFLECVS